MTMITQIFSQAREAEEPTMICCHPSLAFHVTAMTTCGCSLPGLPSSSLPPLFEKGIPSQAQSFPLSAAPLLMSSSLWYGACDTSARVTYCTYKLTRKLTVKRTIWYSTIYEAYPLFILLNTSPTLGPLMSMFHI